MTVPDRPCPELPAQLVGIVRPALRAARASAWCRTSFPDPRPSCRSRSDRDRVLQPGDRRGTTTDGCRPPALGFSLMSRVSNPGKAACTIAAGREVCDDGVPCADVNAGGLRRGLRRPSAPRRLTVASKHGTAGIHNRDLQRTGAGSLCQYRTCRDSDECEDREYTEDRDAIWNGVAARSLRTHVCASPFPIRGQLPASNRRGSVRALI